MCIQGPSEIVEQYAKNIRHLIKRLDYNNHWTNEEWIHMFTKGLKPELGAITHPVLSIMENPTLDEVIMRVQRIEAGQQTYTSYAPVRPVQQVNLASTGTTMDLLVAQLTKNIADLLKPIAAALEGQQRNRGSGQARQIQSRGPPTCFRCQQVGHVARFCPSRVEVQMAPQPITQRQPIQVQAPAAASTSRVNFVDIAQMNIQQLFVPEEQQVQSKSWQPLN